MQSLGRTFDRSSIVNLAIHASILANFTKELTVNAEMNDARPASDVTSPSA